MRILTAAALTLLTLSAHADLSKAQVEKWLTTMKPVQHWMEENESKVNSRDLFKGTSQGLQGMFDGAITELKTAGLYEDFSKLLAGHNYSSVETWAADSRDITTTYMAISMEGEKINPAMIEHQLAQVKASPLPEDQKQMMTGMLQGTLTMMKEVQGVSAADKDIVRPYVKTIEGSFGHGH